VKGKSRIDSYVFTELCYFSNSRSQAITRIDIAEAYGKV